jgi:hypothetical protein
MIKKLGLLGSGLLLYGKFLIGVGTFSVCPTKNGGVSYEQNCDYSRNILPINFLKKNLPNVNAISLWITRDWKEEWYPADQVNQYVKAGYIPIYIFYYFADDISPSFVKQHKKRYFLTLQKFATYLRKVKGPKIVILNPEYNENGMEKSGAFDILQAQSIRYLKSQVKDIKVGVCPGDFGDYDKIWDPENWEEFAPSLKVSSKYADFIAFQEMRAITRNTPQQILNTPYRAWAFATYLHAKYHKPTFLAYLAISSYGKGGEEIQARVYQTFAQILPAMEVGAGLVGINVMDFIDDPKHTGYFNKAEVNWGIIESKGAKKPAFKYFKLFKGI